MRKIVECIPNFSEGRSRAVVDEIVAAIQAVNGAVLLDRESDANHHRSVVTFVAPPEVVVDAAIAAAKKAAELIDLTTHKGEHPRMGATDVIPFVPIAGVTMDDCVTLAKACGARMFQELGIPVYLYEKAATRPERENLAALRKGQFEGIRDEIAVKESRQPDFGAAAVHPTAGITAVGARPPLIAYNINLGTGDLEIANKIARAVRYLSGGLRYVKALGFELSDRGIVQVSMNMVNFEGTPLHRAFEMVKREAERYGVAIVGSEIVGLVPQKALNEASDFYLQLENFSQEQILEHRLVAALEDSDTATREHGVTATGEHGVTATSGDTEAKDFTLGNFAEMVAAHTPVPGGGSVAAHSGMLAASLGQMVCHLTIGKKKYADVEARIKALQSELAELGARLRQLISEDAQSFAAVMQAMKLSKATDAEKAARTQEMNEATRGAILVPMATARTALEVLLRLAELAEIGNQNALSDAAVGGQLALTAVKGAFYNVLINLSSLDDKEEAEDFRNQIDRLVDEACNTAEQIEARMVN
ncbi:MAG: glutamate formimidoyltransferase [Acidobacteria bacterium]|nr:glutamate formimidoyltransferase [Acidobacteriota bacterium]